MQTPQTSDISENTKFATYFYSVNSIRQKHWTPITLNELENYVAEGLWKAYDSLRREASVRLNVPEIDLGICDIKIVGMSVDEHKVVNAEGFEGRSIQIRFMLTICRREDVEKMRGSYEYGVVKANLLGEKIKSKSLIYAESRENRTAIFSSFSGKALHKTDCPWGVGDAISSLGKLFGSDNMEVNKLIYSRLAYQSVSPSMSNKLQKTFLSSFRVLINGISASVSSSASASSGTPDVILNTSLLPEFIKKKNFIFGRKKAKMNQSDISNKDVVDFISKKESVYPELNEVAERRVRWLINTK